MGFQRRLGQLQNADLVVHDHDLRALGRVAADGTTSVVGRRVRHELQDGFELLGNRVTIHHGGRVEIVRHTNSVGHGPSGTAGDRGDLAQLLAIFCQSSGYAFDIPHFGAAVGTVGTIRQSATNSMSAKTSSKCSSGAPAFVSFSRSFARSVNSWKPAMPPDPFNQCASRASSSRLPVTNAVRIATGEDLASLPVRGINNILALTPGVVVQDNAVFIRGGRLDEVGYYLEGVSITNPMLGGRAVNLVQDAVEEIQVQAGGYNAEFGGANSGIIQQQLKSGTPDWRLSAMYQTDNITLRPRSKALNGDRRLGAYGFGYNEFTGTLSGPLVSERIKLFGLFNYLYQRDQAPQPFPGITLGPMTGETGDVVNLTYPAGPLRKNAVEQYNYTGTLTADFTPLTLRFAGTYTSGTIDVPYNTHRNAGAIANILDEGRIEQAPQHNGSANLKLTHLLSAKTFYELNVGYFFQEQKNWDPVMKDDFLGYGDSVANAGAGIAWERSAADIAAGHLGRYIRPTRRVVYGFSFNAPGDLLAGYAKFKRENISLNGALSTQLAEHTIKVGGEFQRYAIRNYSWTNDQVFSLASLLAQNDALPAGDPIKFKLDAYGGRQLRLNTLAQTAKAQRGHGLQLWSGGDVSASPLVERDSNNTTRRYLHAG